MTLSVRISDQNATALDERLARLRELDECTRGTDDPGLRQWRLAMADEIAAIAGLSQIKPDYWVLKQLDELLARAGNPRNSDTALWGRFRCLQRTDTRSEDL